MCIATHLSRSVSQYVAWCSFNEQARLTFVAERARKKECDGEIRGAESDWSKGERGPSPEDERTRRSIGLLLNHWRNSRVEKKRGRRARLSPRAYIDTPSNSFFVRCSRYLQFFYFFYFFVILYLLFSTFFDRVIFKYYSLITFFFLLFYFIFNILWFRNNCRDFIIFA